MIWASRGKRASRFHRMRLCLVAALHTAAQLSGPGPAPPTPTPSHPVPPGWFDCLSSDGLYMKNLFFFAKVCSCFKILFLNVFEHQWGFFMLTTVSCHIMTFHILTLSLSRTCRTSTCVTGSVGFTRFRGNFSESSRCFEPSSSSFLWHPEGGSFERQMLALEVPTCSLFIYFNLAVEDFEQPCEQIKYDISKCRFFSWWLSKCLHTV